MDSTSNYTPTNDLVVFARENLPAKFWLGVNEYKLAIEAGQTPADAPCLVGIENGQLVSHYGSITAGAGTGRRAPT